VKRLKSTVDQDGEKRKTAADRTLPLPFPSEVVGRSPFDKDADTAPAPATGLRPRASEGVALALVVVELTCERCGDLERATVTRARVRQVARLALAAGIACGCPSSLWRVRVVGGRSPRAGAGAVSRARSASGSRAIRPENYPPVGRGELGGIE